ncbi:putative uncharacterized protein [Parabacteroides sp. CAG:409]|nr:putative uncharacterized protein [Parabacteroides sp. CAG:409]
MNPLAGFQLGWRTTDGEARCNDIFVSSFPVPFLYQSTHVGFSLLRCVTKIFRCFLVHLHFPGQHTHIVSGSFFKQNICRLRMNRRKGNCRGRSVTEKLFQECAGDFAAMIRIGKGSFGRKRILVQPVEQLPTVHSRDFGLHIMKMCVDKSRHQDGTLIIDDFRLRIFLQQDSRCSGFYDQSIADA